MSFAPWKMEQIGVGVSRCPTDFDADFARQDQLALPDNISRLDNQDRALGKASWINKPVRIA